MPYGNFGVYQGAAENAALNKRGRNRLAKDLYEYQLAQNIQDRSFIESRDPNVFAPKSHNKVVPLPTRGGPAKYAARDPQDPMIRDWNTIKETAGFVKDNPKEAMELSYLSMMQSPIKLIGRLGEATWARENDNYQNELSNKSLNNILAQDAEAYRRENAPTNGSREDMMNRIKDFQKKQGMVESIRPEYTSDTTLGDVADVASWLIPGPGAVARSAIKTGQVASKVGKVARNIIKEYPRMATAGAAAAGIGALPAYELSRPDEAKAAFSGDVLRSLAPRAGEFGLEILPTGERIRYTTAIPDRALSMWESKVAKSKNPSDRLMNLILRHGVLDRTGGHAAADPKTAAAFVDLISGKDTPGALSLISDFALRDDRALAEQLLNDPKHAAQTLYDRDISAADRLAVKAGTSRADVMSNPALWRRSGQDTSMQQLAEYIQSGSLGIFHPERVHGNEPLSLRRGHFSEGSNPTAAWGSNIINALGSDNPFLSTLDDLVKASGNKLTRGDIAEYTGDFSTPWYKTAERRKALAKRRAKNK